MVFFFNDVFEFYKDVDYFLNVQVFKDNVLDVVFIIVVDEGFEVEVMV